MNLQVLQSTNSTAFTGAKTKKTPRGNEYQITHAARTTGATVGLLSGALAAKIALKPLKTVGGKREFITSLNNMNKTLEHFGKAGAARKVIKKGITALGCATAALGLFVGAIIGGSIDSHNNQKSAKAADKAAKSNA